MLSSTLSLFSVVLAALAAPSPRAVAFSPPAGFNITSVGVIGTGCPPGSAYVLVSDEGSALTAVFSELNALAGPGVPIRDNRKNCQLTLGVNVPTGYSFGVQSVESAGYYQLDAEVSASQGTVYYFQGELAQATTRGSYTGPIEGRDYVIKEEFDLASTVRSPCGKDTVLNLNTDVRVSNSKNRAGFGYLSKDFLQFRRTLNLQWYEC